MEAEILAKVIELAAEQAGMDPKLVTAESHFKNDLNFDSLDDVDFAMAVEEEFELSVPDDDLHQFTVVGDVARYIETHRQPSRAA